MTQNISEACCAKPTEWAGTPAGKEGKVAGLEAYIATPKSSSKGAILYITDVYTWEAKNARLYADKLAQEGFLTVVPDFFHKDYPDMSARDKFPEWLGRHPHDTVVKEAKAVVEELKKEHGAAKVGAVGFCWGGKYSTLLAGAKAVDANVVCHGSLLEKPDISAIQEPTLFLFSDNDPMISEEMRHWIEEELQAKGKEGLATDSHFYPGQAHGWTQKGDDKDPKVAEAAADAYSRTVSFFKANLL